MEVTAFAKTKAYEPFHRLDARSFHSWSALTLVIDLPYLGHLEFLMSSSIVTAAAASFAD